MPYLPVRCLHQRQPQACCHALNVARHTSHDRKDITIADTTPAASLGAKLDTLDLTADEHALLCDLLTPHDAEVSGYTSSFAGMTLSRPLPRPTSTSILAGTDKGCISTVRHDDRRGGVGRHVS